MWIKKGLIYKPKINLWWNQSHAYCPTPFIMEDRIRVYFASWDQNNVGRITFVDFDKTNPSVILYEHDNFILDVGQPGTFDVDGIGPSYVIELNGLIWMYYFGFQKTSDPNATLILCGLATSKDGGLTFTRVSNVPLLERLNDELDLRSSVSIVIEKNIFRVWYTAAIGGWTETNDNLFSKNKYPNYSIRYIESDDGINFHGGGKICLNLQKDEFALGRPWVFKEDNIYKMWYSRRGVSQSYRFGYAESYDGISWIRMDDKIDIDVATIGWDSEMICFPTVINVDTKKYIFYNGNKHGKDGFGLITWE